MNQKLSILSFTSLNELRLWLEENCKNSPGIWVRIYKKGSRIQSVTFEEVLDEGLCFGWSESKRVAGDEVSYLQLFTPRRGKGTTSKRNLEHAQQLIKNGRMTSAGLEALGISN